MFFDLNVLLPSPGVHVPSTHVTKQKKQRQPDNSPIVFTPSQVVAIEARIDLLVHLGYTVIALNQVVQSRVDPKTHINWSSSLIPKLKKRQGVVVLSRLTVILDEESDKGNGINSQNASLLSEYDILSLCPTTESSFSLACLTHSLPSPQTTHIISLPLTLPRLPFRLKHTFIRTASKNGVVFEVKYSDALGPDSGRRNWWGAAREVGRVTKGNGILVTGGTKDASQMRAPRDAANLISLLGIPQNLAHDSLSLTPKAVVLRAHIRKTYRSTLSEPNLIIPLLTEQAPDAQDSTLSPMGSGQSKFLYTNDPAYVDVSRESNPSEGSMSSNKHVAPGSTNANIPKIKKRRREEDPDSNIQKKKEKTS